MDSKQCEVSQVGVLHPGTQKWLPGREPSPCWLGGKDRARDTQSAVLYEGKEASQALPSSSSPTRRQTHREATEKTPWDTQGPRESPRPQVPFLRL